MWTYRDFRRARPDVDTDEGIEVIGYQMLKMGDNPSAVVLLSANLTDYPRSSAAGFGLGRAYQEAGQFANARRQFEAALRLDPTNARARAALAIVRDEKTKRD